MTRRRRVAPKGTSQARSPHTHPPGARGTARPATTDPHPHNASGRTEITRSAPRAFLRPPIN
ncbi:hypothetical protein F3K43_11985 [Streptomyces sp. LBUM 1476]|nr:hypothetical protein [Streptomyces sp. LBUM 1476]